MSITQEDINKYRNPNETEKEWQLKRVFIEKYQDLFAEDRLLCLAQCYANIETMGCRYSNDIMNQIKSLTCDFDPIVKEKLDSNNIEMRKQQKNQSQQSNSNSNNTKTSNSNQQQQPKQKLISKTHIQSKPEVDQIVNPKAAAPQIQILSRNSNLKNTAITSLNTSNTTPRSNPPPENYASLFKPSTPLQQPQQQQQHFKSSYQLQKTQAHTNTLMNILKNSSFSNKQTPQVPVGTTTELSPAPSQLPIPFGLNTNAASTTRRNILLEKLGISSKPAGSSIADTANFHFTQDFLNSTNSLPVALHQSTTNSSSQSTNIPLSLALLGGMTAQSIEQSMLNSQQATATSSVMADFQKFTKLSKINKLRDLLRTDQSQGKHDFCSNNSSDLIDYFKQTCENNNIKLNYIQYSRPDGLYYGELFLESFRLVCEQNKKRKRSMYYAYKNGLDLLIGPTELAVKAAPRQRRDQNIRLDTDELLDTDTELTVDFEYELYQIDSNQGPGGGSNNNNFIFNTLASIEQESMSLPPMPVVSMMLPESQPNLHDLNMMLKSMILPKKTSNSDAD